MKKKKRKKDETLVAVPITYDGFLHPSVNVDVSIRTNFDEVDMRGEDTKLTLSIHSEIAALELVNKIVESLARMHRKNEGEDVIEIELRATVGLDDLQLEPLTEEEESVVQERYDERMEKPGF